MPGHMSAVWPRIAHRLCRDFRYLEKAALTGFAAIATSW